ncbi:hypothetical protein BLNAU_6184 [Blattamonas nauphoetae]|uniref:Uncharacterized protein n=1 Tax=Blattamonas nauphoetae TaxID=2049346 RepID=A0ABQ9Y5B0_9EUKA|nr:hypothetical protein BLNAU_6184 [Blattamonas nauphoetae]
MSRGEELKDDDVMIDASFSFHIKPASDTLPIALRPSSTFSSDLSVLAFKFAGLLSALSSHGLLQPPNEFVEEYVDLFLTLTVVLRLVQCGSLGRVGSSQQDLQNELFHRLVTGVRNPQFILMTTSFTPTHITSFLFLSKQSSSANRFNFVTKQLLPFINENGIRILSHPLMQSEFSRVFPRLKEFSFECIRNEMTSLKRSTMVKLYNNFVRTQDSAVTETIRTKMG